MAPSPILGIEKYCEISMGEGWGEGNGMDNDKSKYARYLRKHSTNAERELWYYLRNRNLNRHKFKRQYPIPPYIVDFVCERKKLVIELDGGQHAGNEKYDKKNVLII